jgi:nucleoid-associated protein YgaU/DNA-binding SARP family transcriptional activator
MNGAAHLRRVALSIASTLTLVALLLGVPALLSALHGRPDHLNTTFAGLGDVIAGGRLDPVAVVDLIALMAWAAWLVIAVAIALELGAWIRGRPTPHLGIAGPIQPLVRNLVATATLLVATLASPVRGGAATIVNAAVVAPAQRPVPMAEPLPVVQTPAPTPPPSCIVVSHDTLWGLAETHLNNPLRWREIFELNRGVLQPDGRRLEDPDLIIPGWTLQLPAGAVELAPAPAAPATAPPSQPAAPTPPPAPTGTTVAVPPTTTAHTPNTTTPKLRESDQHADRGLADSPDQTTRIAMSAITAAGLVVLLTTLRLARRRRRRPATKVTPSAQRVETDLRRAAVESVSLLNLSLRALGRALRLSDSRDARFLVVRVLDGRVEILLDTPLARDPEGFAPTDDRRGWITAPGLTSQRLQELADGEPAPAPCLVSLGTLDGEVVLIDLETAGLLTVLGDEEDIASVVRHLALELATSAIADHVQVLVVGGRVLGEIGDAHPRLCHLELDDAIIELEATAHANEREREALDAATESTNTVANEGDGPGCPTVLVSFEPVDEPARRRIEAAVGDGNRRIAAVVPSEDRATWHVDLGDAVLRLAPLGLVLEPFALDAETADEIDELIAAPPGADFDGLPDAHPGPPTVSVAPFVERPFDLEIRVLGPVEVVGAAQSFARHRHLEITVYLALHPDGVSDERLKSALWPERAPSTATFNSTISTTRSRLGHDTSGEPLFPHYATANRRYQLGAAATSDYARFVVRVDHARQAETAEAIADLSAALDLVRGQPFAEVHGFEWAWSEGFVANLEIAVARAAHDLARRYIELGEWDAAIWAAMQGLLAAPADEILYRDRMLACDLAGNPAGVETVMQELRHAVEAVEPWDGIHPETVALYQRLRHGRKETSLRR